MYLICSDLLGDAAVVGVKRRCADSGAAGSAAHPAFGDATGTSGLDSGEAVAAGGAACCGCKFAMCAYDILFISRWLCGLVQLVARARCVYVCVYVCMYTCICVRVIVRVRVRVLCVGWAMMACISMNEFHYVRTHLGIT